MRSIAKCGLLVLIGSMLACAQATRSNEPEFASNLVTARIIGALEQIRQLESLSRQGGRQDLVTIIAVRQQISEEILSASLQVDATTAQIDNETARAHEIRGLLADRRDHSVNRANLLSVIVGGTLGAASSGLQIPNGQTKPSAAVGIAAGTLSSGFGIAGIRAQKGGTREFDFDSNMLARLFDRPTLPDSKYLPVVWAFLNEVAPTDPNAITRRDRLVRTWIELKRLDTSSGPAQQQKIERMTSQPSQRLRLSIDDLEDRAAMLEDLRAKLSFLKRDLATLLSSLPAIQTAALPIPEP